MKTIQSTETVTIRVTEADLIEGKWIHYQLLSKKLSDMEKSENMGYKSLRNRLYNSCACNKYNVKTIAGLKCIDIDNPMTGNASLILNFERA